MAGSGVCTYRVSPFISGTILLLVDALLHPLCLKPTDDVYSHGPILALEDVNISFFLSFSKDISISYFCCHLSVVDTEKELNG